jgi:hypothetical protein
MSFTNLSAALSNNLLFNLAHIFYPSFQSALIGLNNFILFLTRGPLIAKALMTDSQMTYSFKERL